MVEARSRASFMTIRLRFSVETLRVLAVLLVVLIGGLVFGQSPSASQPITLRFSVWDGDESLKVIRKIITRFENENPGIKIKLENNPDYNVYHQKMLVEYAANTAPDVAMMDPAHFQALATRGAILPLNQFFSKTPGFNINDYYKPIVDAHSLDGKIYVLPRDIAPEGLIYYNKKEFDEAHIPYPDGSWTWDFHERPELKQKDFLWVMHQLTKLGKDGNPTQYGYLAAYPGLAADTFMWSYGARPENNDSHPTKVLYDTPEMIKVYDFYCDLSLHKKWMVSNNEVTNVMQQGAETIFVAGKTAMFQNGIWEVPNIRRDMKPGSKDFFDWDIAMFPAYANGHRAFPTGGSGYSIFSSTKYPDAAWKFTRYMAGPVAMEAMARAGIAQPAIRKVALTDAWIPGPNTPLDQQWPHSRIVTDQDVPFVKFGPTAEYWPEIQSMIDARRDSIYNGLISPAQGLKLGTDEAQNRLDSLLKEETLPPFNWPVGMGLAVFIVAAILIGIYLPERGRRFTTRQKRENLAAYKFLSPWLIGLAVFTIGPMILSLLMSFMKWDMIGEAKFRGLHNYSEAFTEDPRFWVSMRVTAIYTLIATPMGIFVAFLLALLLNQRVRGVPLFRAMFYVPSIASTVALTLVTRKILSPDNGLMNSIIYSPFLNKTLHLGDLMSSFAGTPHDQVNWLGNEHTTMISLVLLSLFGVGGSMIVLLAGLQGIPQFYYEAATVDGASAWHRLRNITVPLLTPSIFFTLVTGFIGSFQVFTQVYIITNGNGGGPNNSMLVYMVTLYSAAFQSLRMGYAAALAWVLFAVILGFTLIQFKASKWVYYEADVK
jgi:ABC-type sugar transport system permease subunit/ABC-type glycerol-3-phosphate transport system substrate-binding protein